MRGLTRAAREALQRGDDEGAEALCRRALAHDDTDIAAWTLLGTALRRRDAAGAEAALRLTERGRQPLHPVEAEAHPELLEPEQPVLGLLGLHAG